MGNFVISLFELFVFLAAIFSMDYTAHTPNFLLMFAFECEIGKTSVWWIEKSLKSSTLWELHIIIVFMYTTLAILVMSTIPYRYDRFIKSEKEIKKEEERAKKKAEKKAEKKALRRSERYKLKLDKLQDTLLL